MYGQSLSPHIENINQLKHLFPEVFCEGKIDWEKLKATLGEEVDFSNERYVLNWAGKSNAFRTMQEPSTKTLIPVESESVNFDETENIYIEGENMEVLKILQKSYFGKVKMIYIDPPYNTGNDSFIYPDKFSESKEVYQKRVGDKDEDGYMTGEGMFRKNSRENGQYHSNWLNMMMPRLYLAKNLLREDGVIFVSIDDNEVHNLRLLMNEIFGEENFVAQIVWERAFSPINLMKHFSPSHDYILCFAKNMDLVQCNGISRSNEADARYSNPDNDPRGVWSSSDISVGPAIEANIYAIATPSGREVEPPAGRSWSLSEKAFSERLADNRIWFGAEGDSVPRIKRFLSELRKSGITPMTLWKHTEVGHSQGATQALAEIFNGKKYFDYPKPIELIKRCISLYTEKDSLILDFFSGSATTAHAVMQLNKEDGGNRKFILVQMPELCDEKSEACKAGYKSIADIGKERIRRAGRKIQDEIAEDNKKTAGGLDFDEEKTSLSIDTGFKVFKLSESNFKQWHQPNVYSAEVLAEQLQLFVDPVSKEADLHNMVYELLLKSGKDLNADIELKNGYYLIDGNDLALILEKVDEKIIAEVLAEHPKKVIALDRTFNGNDQLKTNTSLQMRDAGVEFKTI